MELNISEVTEAVEAVDRLSDRLLVLRFNLGKLEAAVERAFAPITGRVVPILDTAVQALTDFANGAGQVIAALFGGVRVEAAKTVSTTTKALKRSVADFDRLDRLSGTSGSGTATVTVPAKLKAVEAQYQAIAERIKQILSPLKSIDLSAACDAFAALRKAAEPLTRSLFSGLEWVWFNILTPMAQWAVEQALPVFLNTLAAGLKTLGTLIQTVKPVFSWLWENLLKPMGQWAAQSLLSALQTLTDYLQDLSEWLLSVQPTVEAFTQKLSQLKTAFDAMTGGFGLWNGQWGALGVGMGLLAGLAQTLSKAFGSVADIVDTVRKKLTELFGSLAPGFRVVVNGGIGILNAAASAVESALNAMVSVLNGFKLEIPSWVPVVGGRKFSMSFGYVDLPSVPYLAQGAVLPANKPFLAMVGDQRHGTNVEAPLATIQQAVAEVMGQGSAAQLDTNRLLAQILTAIGAIEVGDETIGRAARRYESRMALMGGAL